MITRRSFLKALVGLPLIGALPKLKGVSAPSVQPGQPRPVGYITTSTSAEPMYINTLRGDGVQAGQLVGLDEMGQVKPYTCQSSNSIGLVVGGPDENGNVQVIIRGGFFTK